jgi:hypothetical protein
MQYKCQTCTMSVSTIAFSPHSPKKTETDLNEVSTNAAANNDNNNNGRLQLEYERKEKNEYGSPSFDHTKHPALFQICQDCYWCATIISSFISMNGLEDRVEERCPLCANDNIDVLTICPRETFRFELDTRRGISLAFR